MSLNSSRLHRPCGHRLPSANNSAAARIILSLVPALLLALQEAAGPGGINAFIDLFGPQYLDLAAELGVLPGRIETVVPSGRAMELGVKTDGSVNASTPEILAELANLVATSAVEVPVAATYPLDRVTDAFAELERRHTRGKIVLIS